MKCKECIDEGKKSNVYPGMSTRTAMHCPPYYDNHGKYHHHDSNITKTEYSCSNGHSWIDSSRGQCGSCDWGHDQ
jgi:hypothetical protein